jgi:hypothetical protein
VVLKRLAIVAFVVRAQHRCGTELFDELQTCGQTWMPDTTLVRKSYLLECLVVDEARRIFGNIELPLLDVLAELPGDNS